MQEPEPWDEIGVESPAEGGFDFAEEDDVILEYEDNNETPDFEEEFLCELDDGSTLPIQGTPEQLVELRTLLNTGQIVSAESSVATDQISTGADGDDFAPIIDPDNINEFVTLPPGDIQVINNENNRRRLNKNKYEGKKKVLIVRVTDKDGRSVDGDAKFVSDKFFGNGVDQVTMASGFAACSFGKFTMTSDYEGTVNTDLLSAPGVLDIKIDVSLPVTSQETLRSKIAQAAKAKLGVKLPNTFDHVVYVVQKCYKVGTSCGFAAYAYVNGFMSVFVGNNYKYAAVQMHEIGQ